MLAVPTSRHTDQQHSTLQSSEEPQVASRPIDEQVAQAYRDVITARGGDVGDWVGFASIRSRVKGNKTEVDEVLKGLERLPDVQISPDTAQFDLSEADRAAAVRIGGKDKHILKMEQTALNRLRAGTTGPAPAPVPAPRASSPRSARASAT
jgi:hypothetical protein